MSRAHFGAPGGARDKIEQSADAHHNRGFEAAGDPGKPDILARYAQRAEQDFRSGGVDLVDERVLVLRREIAIGETGDLQCGNGVAGIGRDLFRDTRTAAEQEDALLALGQLLAERDKEVGAIEIVAKGLANHTRGDLDTDTVGQNGVAGGEGGSISPVGARDVRAMRIQECDARRNVEHGALCDPPNHLRLELADHREIKQADVIRCVRGCLLGRSDARGKIPDAGNRGVRACRDVDHRALPTKLFDGQSSREVPNAAPFITPRKIRKNTARWSWD